MNLLYGILISIAAHILSFFQLQGQFKIPFLKNNIWAVVLLGIPISYLFIYSVRYLVEYYDGQIWPSRIIGFSTGTIVFIILSYFTFNEAITVKTAICVALSVLILVIQLFWK